MAAIDAYANFAYSKVFVAPAPATTGTSVTLAAGTGGRLPPVPFNASVWPTTEYPEPTNAEIVRVTARTGDQLTIVRAQEGTTARAMVVGDAFAATITKKTLDDLRDATNLSSGMIPDARLSANVAMRSQDNHYTGSSYLEGTSQVVVDPAAPVGKKWFRERHTGGFLIFESLNEGDMSTVGPPPLRLAHGGGVHVDSLFVGGKRAVDLETIYPVGSIYMNASNGANPASLFGFGSWVEFGPGRALVCYDASQAEFNAPEKAGGFKAHTLSAAEMPYHTHVQDAHAHSVYDPGHAHGVSDPGHNHAESAHSHSLTGVCQNGVQTVGRYEFTTSGSGPDSLAWTQAAVPNANTNAATAANVAAVTGVAIAAAVTGVATYPATPTNQYAGGNVPHNNLQPFITCFIWKRVS